MATFGQSLITIGANAIADSDLIVARIRNGRILHAVASSLINDEIDTDADVYLASGAFAAGSVTASGGRKQENLQRVLWLPFDADLLDYSGMGDEELHALPQTDIDAWINAQRTDLEEVFRKLAIPMHRLDYTGYGLCAYVYIDHTSIDDIPVIREIHKATIAAINSHAGIKLVDPQASDSGTRITRIPGSWNQKNPAMPRQVKTLAYQPGARLIMDQLRFLGRRAGAEPEKPDAAEPIELSTDTVTEIVAAIAPHWTLGQKHAVSLALAGMLAKSGVPEAQTLDIIERLSAGDEKPWDRKRTVEDTYKRLRSGLDTQGFYGLRSLLPETVLTYVSARLDRYRQATTGAFRFEAGKQTGTPDDTSHVTAMTISPVPDICYSGWVGEYVSLMLPLSEAPEQFHLAAGLGLIGASAGRRVSARYVSRDLYPNLYLMIVGVAGKSRKDTAIDFAFAMPDHQDGRVWNDAPFKELTDVGSPQGLMRGLEKYSNIWLHVTEYERLSQNAHRTSTSAIIPLITTAWNTPKKIENVTQGTPIEAKFPYLSIISAVQPETLAKEMLPADIANGYASRWLFIPGEGGDPISDPPDVDEITAHHLYARLLKIFEKYDGKRLYLSPQAKERWDAWYVADGKRKLDTDDEYSMQSRLGVHIRKVSLIYAASVGAQAIELEHLESAIAFVEWCWEHTRQLMRTWGVPMFNQVEARVEQVLRKKGPIKRRILQKNCQSRKWTVVDFARVVDVMVRNGTIAVDSEGNHAWAG